jgi:hypothetical protein
MRILDLLLLVAVFPVVGCSERGTGREPEVRRPADPRSTSKEQAKSAAGQDASAEAHNDRDASPASPSVRRAADPIEALGGLAETEGDATDAPVVFVRLSGAKVTDAALSHVKGFRKLRRLDLSFSRVTDDGLALLKDLAELQTLDLSGTQVTGAGLAHLAGLARLESLDLYGTQVGDADLAALERLPKLKYLGLRGTRVTEAGVQALKNAVPGVAVDR